MEYQSRQEIPQRDSEKELSENKADLTPSSYSRETVQCRFVSLGNDSSHQSSPLSPNRTGLPEHLKLGVEALSGYSMDDVRVHYNSNKPAQLKAHAYAQGSDIYLGPGQTGHLPHEAWHVAQQKQGRVGPTMQLKGRVNINDDAGLEKEADVMGSRALGMQLNPTRPMSTLGSTNNVVQRAIAIEAESHDTWKVSGKRDGDIRFNPIRDTKSALGSSGKVDLTSDNGNLEYVTGTLSDEDEVHAAFQKMGDALNALAGESPVVIDSLPKEVAGLNWQSQVGYEQYRLAAPSRTRGRVENATFAPQATIDIPFSSFTAYIKKFSDEKNATLMGNHFGYTAEYLSRTSPGKFMSLNMFASMHPATVGFLKMVLMALYDAWGFAGGEDPKYAFPTMPRNRFSEMYTAANDASGGNLEAVFPTFAEQVVAMRGEYGIPNLFTRGYRGDEGVIQGPTVQEWFDSITAPEFMSGDFAEGEIGARSSDLLSPPPGQRARREGLGAYDLAGGTVPFFELRDFMSSHSSRRPKKLSEIYEAALELLAIEKTLR